MLEITNWSVYDLKESVIACRNAMRVEGVSAYTDDEFSKSLVVASRLSKKGGGSGHSNFRKGIRVSFDIRYPNYFSLELQRYGFIDIVCSTSKMHRLLGMDMERCFNEYVSEESKRLMGKYIDEYNALVMRDGGCSDDERYKAFMRVLSNCPLGIELYMRVSTNYEQLATIYRQRKGHRLREDWGAFCRWIEQLPYADELLICDIEK